MILIVGGTSNATECEISKDNITYSTINSTRYMGCVDIGIATINKLSCGTDYTLRCKNTTTNWGYETFNTENCGVSEMEIAIMMLVLGLIAIGGYLSWYFKLPANIVPMLATGILIVFALNLLANLGIDAGLSATTQNLLWFAYKMSLYVYFGAVFFGLIGFLSYLKINKVKKPRFQSPMQQAKSNRKYRRGY